MRQKLSTVCAVRKTRRDSQNRPERNYLRKSSKNRLSAPYARFAAALDANRIVLWYSCMRRGKIFRTLDVHTKAKVYVPTEKNWIFMKPKFAYKNMYKIYLFYRYCFWNELPASEKTTNDLTSNIITLGTFVIESESSFMMEYRNSMLQSSDRRCIGLSGEAEVGGKIIARQKWPWEGQCGSYKPVKRDEKRDGWVMGERSFRSPLKKRERDHFLLL